MNKLNRRTIRTYTFVPEDNMGHEVFKIILEDSLFESKGHIEIIDEELTPIDIKLTVKLGNNYAGAMAYLKDRALPSNRMFLAEYCERKGLNIDDINDRLKLSHGRTYEDNLCIVMDEKILDE